MSAIDVIGELTLYALTIGVSATWEYKRRTRAYCLTIVTASGKTHTKLITEETMDDEHNRAHIIAYCKASLHAEPQVLNTGGKLRLGIAYRSGLPIIIDQDGRELEGCTKLSVTRDVDQPVMIALESHAYKNGEVMSSQERTKDTSSYYDGEGRRRTVSYGGLT